MKAQKLRGREGILSARIVSIFVLATLLLSAPLANAVPVTIEISGEVTSVEGDVGSVPSTIYEGVSFSGTYTYDSSTSDSDDSPNIGKYVHNSPYGISLFLGGYEFKTTSNHIGKFNISIHNDDPQANLWDYYMVESDEIISAPPVGFSVDHIRWVLGDITHAALDSDALPITAPVLTDWGYNVLRISGSGDLGGLLIEGTVTQAVPEPLTGVLMVMGVLFFRRRRKTMKAQKLRGREGINSAKIFLIATLFIFLMLQPLQADTVWESGHHEINDGDIYGEVDIYNDFTLDIFGGEIYRLAAFDTTITDWYNGTMIRLWARDDCTVNIYGGSLDFLWAAEYSCVNLVAYDVTVMTTGGWYDQGYVTGTFYCNDIPFYFDLSQDSYLHINIIPEPATFLLISLGLLFLRKR